MQSSATNCVNRKKLKTPFKTIKESAATHRNHAVSRSYWHTCFREGTTNINDKKRKGEKEESYTDVRDVSGEKR